MQLFWLQCGYQHTLVPFSVMASSDGSFTIYDMRRTRLCRHGSSCQHDNCSFAHALCDLRSPNEVQLFYPVAWEKGIDRWFGQNMQQQQVDLILKFYTQTPNHTMPQWAHGLISILGGPEWDGDQDMICQYRRGGYGLVYPRRELPFHVIPALWPTLHARRNAMQAMANGNNPPPRCWQNIQWEADSQDGDLRHRLCPQGSTCDGIWSHCKYAHGLSELKAPVEDEELRPEVWSEGVDRWFGQAMRPSQLQLISRYHRQCRRGECPSWVYGLLIMIGGQPRMWSLRRQWDYGLCMDLNMLCEHRGTAVVPFSFMPMFWSALRSRRLECEGLPFEQ